MTWHVPDPMSDPRNDDLPRAFGEAELCGGDLELPAVTLFVSPKDKFNVTGIRRMLSRILANLAMHAAATSDMRRDTDFGP